MKLREPLTTKKAAETKTHTSAKFKNQTAPAKPPAGKMTKTVLVRYMAEQMELTPKQIGAFFDILVETATSQTRTTGEFTIPGLGKLVKAERKARVGRNPATGEAINIAARTTLKFRLAKGAKDAIEPAKG